MMPLSVERLVWKLLFAVGGYVHFWIGLVFWRYLLWRTLKGPGLISWEYGVAWGGAYLALRIILLFGHKLLNYLSLHDLYVGRHRPAWIIGARPPKCIGISALAQPDQGWSLSVDHLTPPLPALDRTSLPKNLSPP